MAAQRAQSNINKESWVEVGLRKTRSTWHLPLLEHHPSHVNSLHLKLPDVGSFKVG